MVSAAVCCQSPVATARLLSTLSPQGGSARLQRKLVTARDLAQLCPLRCRSRFCFVSQSNYNTCLKHNRCGENNTTHYDISGYAYAITLKAQLIILVFFEEVILWKNKNKNWHTTNLISTYMTIKKMTPIISLSILQTDQMAFAQINITHDWKYEICIE